MDDTTERCFGRENSSHVPLLISGTQTLWSCSHEMTRTPSKFLSLILEAVSLSNGCQNLISSGADQPMKIV
jgi:hypothetical protein